MSKPPPRPPGPPGPAVGQGPSTYEIEQALSRTALQADPISWSSAKSYRSSPYRHLHHQEGLVGTFNVRLLEARNLERSHWSVLGMGPVRHLGLSRAHGEVSSFIELSLAYRYGNGDIRDGDDQSDEENDDGVGDINKSWSDNGTGDGRMSSAADVSLVYAGATEGKIPADADASDQSQGDDYAQQAFLTMSIRDAASAAAASSAPVGKDRPLRPRTPSYGSLSEVDTCPSDFSSHIGDCGNEDEDDRKLPAKEMLEGIVPDTVETMYEPDHAVGTSNGGEEPRHKRDEVGRSSVQRNNNNPIWPTSQRGGNRSMFALRLQKGQMKDGQRILLQIRAREEMTGVESAVPDPFGMGLIKGGGDGTIGVGTVDITDLALGHVQGGVLAVWCKLYLRTSPSSAAAASASRKIQETTKCTGRVRVLVSYEPHGMCLRRGDLAALEVFARCNISMTSCRPLLPPLSPLRVLEVVGSHCLVEYDLPPNDLGSMTSRDRRKHMEAGSDGDRDDGRKPNSSASRKTGTARIHRTALFVIERTNAVDSALNMALTPVDAVLSTALGQAASKFAGPVLSAAGDLVAPAMLTGRLMLAGGGTLTKASISGAGAVVGTLANSLDPNRKPFDENDPLSKL